MCGLTLVNLRRGINERQAKQAELKKPATQFNTRVAVQNISPSCTAFRPPTNNLQLGWKQETIRSHAREDNNSDAAQSKINEDVHIWS